MKRAHIGIRGGAVIGAARVRVADVADEEFEKARLRARTCGGEKGVGAVGEGDELVIPSPSCSTK